MVQEQRRKNIGLVAIRETTATIAVMQALVGKWMAGKTILWVDDHRENNAIIRTVFEEAGPRLSLAKSTEEAMGLLRGTDRAVDLVISDMGRGDDPVAGLTLFAAMQLSEMTVPRIVYSDSPQARERSKRISDLGGTGPVVGPENLARAVSRVLSGHGSPITFCSRPWEAAGG